MCVSCGRHEATVYCKIPKEIKKKHLRKVPGLTKIRTSHPQHDHSENRRLLLPIALFFFIAPVENIKLTNKMENNDIKVNKN